MLQLFPQFKKRILISEVVWILFLIVFALCFPAVPFFILILAAIAGTLAMLCVQHLDAGQVHNQLLAKLYNDLNAEGFIAEYAPLLERPARNEKLIVGLRLHLSNAYCALGRFDEAIALLENVSTPKAKPEQSLLFRFTLLSNMCHCALQKGDLPLTETYLSALHSVSGQIEEMQKRKPEKKRMRVSSKLNDVCADILRGKQANLDFLKKQVQGGHQLHKVTTSLWIARVQLAQNNRREAEKLLKRIVELAPNLYPGKQAAQMLAQLPDKKA